MWADFYSRLAQQCSFVRLRGFQAKRFEVRGCLLCHEVAAHLFNRENSTFYGDDISYYFPQYVVESSVCVDNSKPSEAIIDQTPRFNNSEFIDNSSPSFLNLVITMDTNIKWDVSNTLPRWPQWIEEDLVEMLFDRTEMGVPMFELEKTCEG